MNRVLYIFTVYSKHIIMYFNNLLIIWKTSDLRSKCQAANSFIEKRHKEMKPVISDVNVRHIVAH